MKKLLVALVSLIFCSSVFAKQYCTPCTPWSCPPDACIKISD